MDVVLEYKDDHYSIESVLMEFPYGGCPPVAKIEDI